MPLFPLGTVLFPQGALPLRIFEVRYLDMVNKCLQTGAPFGVVALTQGAEVQIPQSSEAFARIGTLATITQHAAPQAGLKLVQCVGQQRFRILRQERLRHGLWVADIEHIDADQAVALPTELQPCASVLRRVIAQLPPQALAEPLAAADSRWNDCAWVANRWCELLPMPTELKQRMLELDNPVIRLELVGDLLEKFQLL
ncbi:MAG: LON peptidase substrate-binding domain-containing protein [Burkholderiaceae bacterium]